MIKPLFVVDVETSGLDPYLHEITEISIMHIDRRTLEPIFQLTTKAQFDYLSADPGALKINGFDPAAWRDATTQKKLAEMLVSYLDGAQIIGHNPSFDVSFLRALFARHRIKCIIDHRLIDTMTLAHEHLEPLGLESLSLDSIRGFLSWSLDDAHTAEQDVIDTARLYKLLIRASSLTRFFIKLRHLYTHRSLIY